MGSKGCARRRGTAAIAGGVVLLAAAAALLAGLMAMRGASVSPDPGGDDGTAAVVDAAGDVFPAVDWEKWRSVNPDVCGWVSVPGTDVSYPVLQAHSDDPEFYLHHDVYRRWNVYGSVYLDAECEGGLLASDNAVLYGHHMNDGSMFAALASYSDAGWAGAHATVLVQTPEHRCAYRVRCARVVDASSDGKHAAFRSRPSFEHWRQEESDRAAVRLGAFSSDRVLSLVTCSYHYFGNERTVALAEPVWVDGIAVAGPTAAEAVLGKTPSELAAPMWEGSS